MIDNEPSSLSTCGTPWLVDVYRGTLVVLDLFVGEGGEALLPLHCIARLVFTENTRLLGTLGARVDLHQPSGGQRQALLCREPGIVNLIRDSLVRVQIIIILKNSSLARNTKNTCKKRYVNTSDNWAVVPCYTTTTQ